MDKSKYTCYIDLEGHQTSAGGTIPPNKLVTTLKPDVVIIDNEKNETEIFELTVPGEQRLKKAYDLKLDKYQHFTTDITNCKVTPIEVGSHTGYINQENKLKLRELHKYCRKGVKLKDFEKNISAIALLSSYYIFTCRNLEDWNEPDKILAPWP